MRSLLQQEGLDRYYALRGERGQPVAAASERRDRKWLEPFEARVAAAEGLCRLDLDVQGIHCAACVWLIERWFERQPGAVRIVVNPSLGKAQMSVRPAFALGAFADTLERFGYLLGPARKRAAAGSSELVTRMGICIALAMNAMLFSIAMYAGLTEGPLHRLFATLEFALSLASVVVGGPVFFRSAWAGLRRGLLHLDLPIAAGIALAFSSSAWSFFSQAHARTYFDTLSVFVALMLVGRFLQERVLENNKRFLLESDGTDGLLTRRVRDGHVETVRCAEVASGDVLLVAPGDLLPVASVLDADEASFSLDWIDGESEPRRFTRGATVPAGAFLGGIRPVELVSAEDFAGSPLVDLVRAPVEREADEARATPFWRVFARVYVGAVLGVALLAFGFAWLRAHDLAQATSIVTAVLIVTCPCAFGIATPLAYEIVLARLRRAGLFVRSAGFLDRVGRVRRVVFDKTGTLTTGALEVEDASALASLTAGELGLLANLALRTHHPKGAAIARIVPREHTRFEPGLAVEEHAGRGLSLVHGGHEYRLGAPAWAAGGGELPPGDVTFGVDGRVLAAFTTREEVRADARAEIAALVREGYDVRILSGDASPRVAAMAASCGLAPDRAVGACSASGKAGWLREHDAKDTLMVGDGINDSLAVSAAWCSGTLAIDRPFMAARSDFYLVTAGLAPIRLALRAGRLLERTVRLNLAMALAYNVAAVALAFAGLMSPLLCAVLMPLSSLTVLFATMASLSNRRASWAS